MSVEGLIADGNGSGLTAHVHRLEGGEHAGVLALTDRFRQFNPEVHPFLNDDFGISMNQNIAFGGTPEGIHDGTDSALWTGAAGAGTWDFSDTTNPSAGSNCVSITSANNNDNASFTDGTETNMANYTAITGVIRLETYSPVNNTIVLQFLNNASAVGGSVNLNDYINTGLLDIYQGFVIPKADMGVESVTVDQIDMTVTRLSGTKPTFRFDTWQIEETGNPAIFLATTPEGSRFHVTEIRIAMADALAGTLADGTMPALAYDQILGVGALTNGIVFSRVQNGETKFAVNLKQLGDFLGTGSNLINAISDGTNTFIGLLVEFPEPIVLEGGSGNFLSFTINDNLSGLLQFTASARGAIEVPIAV